MAKATKKRPAAKQKRATAKPKRALAKKKTARTPAQPAPKLQASSPILDQVRTLCLSLPEASERPSHGSPCFFVNKRPFVSVADNHHGDGRFALWCAAPEGAQAMLVDSEPDHYFLPPYVAKQGWIGVHLDRAPWSAVAMVIENAYLARANPKQAAKLHSS